MVDEGGGVPSVIDRTPAVPGAVRVDRVDARVPRIEGAEADQEVDREVGYYADKEDAYYMKKDLQAKHPHTAFPAQASHFP